MRINPRTSIHKLYCIKRKRLQKYIPQPLNSDKWTKSLDVEAINEVVKFVDTLIINNDYIGNDGDTESNSVLLKHFCIEFLLYQIMRGWKILLFSIDSLLSFDVTTLYQIFQKSQEQFSTNLDVTRLNKVRGKEGEFPSLPYIY